jgi:glycosyltransferase involved in cell wall biosynthesis
VGDAAAVVGTSGRIVPPGDARALAEAWEALLALEGEERQALGRQARHIVEVGYNIQTTAERYLTLYRSLFSKS